MSQSILPGPTFRAGGTIAPFSCVKIDPTADNQVVQCSAVTDLIIGIAQEGMLGTPGLAGSDTTIAAVAGGNIQVITTGVAIGIASAAIVRGSRVRTTVTGQLVTLGATAGQWNVVGVALESANNAGDLIKILVNPDQVTV